MRLIFIEIYHEIRLVYYFLKFIGFEIYFLKIRTLKKNLSDQKYLNLINNYKNKGIKFIEFLNEDTKDLIYENFDNDFTGETFQLNNELLSTEKLQNLFKNFNINISEDKFNLYIRSILQSNIQKKFHTTSTILDHWLQSNFSKKKSVIVLNDFKNYFLNINDKKVRFIYIPLNLFHSINNIVLIIFKFFKKIFKKLNVKKSNTNLKLNNKIETNYTSKYIYIFHKSTNYAKLFSKDLFFFEHDKYLSNSNMTRILYNKNSENIFNILEIPLKEKIIYILKTNLFFLKLFFFKFSIKNIAISLLFSKIYFRFLSFNYNLKKFKYLEAAFIDWDTNCPKELIMALELNGVRTICAQERSIQSRYKYFYNVICDTFLSSVPNMEKIFMEKPFSKVNRVIEYGNYRQDYFFDKKHDEFIKKIFKINEKDIVVLLYLNHTENSFKDQVHDPITNWDNHLFFLKETYELLNNKKNLKVIYRFKNIDWLKIDKFNEIKCKIENTENMYIDKEYNKSYFSYSLARFADIVIGPHSSIIDELIQAGFTDILIMDYGYKLKSMLKKFNMHENYLCENKEQFLSKLNVLLNKSKYTNFKNNSLKQEIKYKDKLYHILKNQIKL